MTAEFKKILIRESLIFGGFVALFFVGFALARAAFNPLLVLTLILIGLYGYPAFVIIRYTTRTLKAFKSLDAANQRDRKSVV